jgi:hypothetical protein
MSANPDACDFFLAAGALAEVKRFIKSNVNFAGGAIRGDIAQKFFRYLARARMERAELAMLAGLVVLIADFVQIAPFRMFEEILRMP